MTYHATADVGPYWVGDNPGSFEIDVTDDIGEVADLEAFTAATAELFAPGTITNPVAMAATLNALDGSVTVEWPEDTPVAADGLYAVRIRLTGPAGSRYVDPLNVVGMAFDGWISLSQAAAWWSDAPSENPSYLYMLLYAAKRAILGWAKELPEGTPPPPHYIDGQLLQAQAIYTLGQSNPQESVGFEQLSVRVYPLDWNIKQLVRPRRAIPVAT